MRQSALAKIFGIGWLALLVMRLAMNYAGASTLATLPRIALVVVPVTAFWLPVTVAVLWIDRRRGARGRTVLAIHALMALAAALAEPWIAQRMLASVGADRTYLTLLIGRLDTNILVYALIAAADLGVMRLEAFRTRERAAARLERALGDAQLQALAIQLQPHFLFNALQFVAETAHDDLPTARRTLTHLRDLVREAFAMEHRIEVRLDEELSFLSAYGEIQRSRFGERFELTIEAAEDVRGAAVPPLLLQPLVENAARHGFGKRATGGHVHVSARRAGETLVIAVADDGAGLREGFREGQGISVTRRRLERLHGGAASLSLGREGARTVTAIRFPLRPALAPSVNTPVVPPELSAPSPLDEVSPRLSMGLRVAAFWIGLMTLVIGATAASALFGPYPEGPLGMEHLLFHEVVGFPFWLSMTIAAVWSRRFRGPWAIPAHAVIGVGLAMAHVFLGDDVARMFFDEARPFAAYQQWATWDVLVYAALVAVARSHDLREWLRDKVREEVTLSAQVLQANERLGRLREMQSDLLDALDDVIASPTMETLDRAVVEFAEFLRGEVMPGTMAATAGMPA